MRQKKYFPAISLLLLAAFSGCKDDAPQVDYRAEMRTFVQRISERGEALRPGFLVVPQNGERLLTLNGAANGTLATNYVNAVDGFGREELFYGYNNEDDAPNTTEEQGIWQEMCVLGNNLGKKILVTDYCFTPSRMDDSYARNAALGFLSFAADHRELDNIPAYPAGPYAANTNNTAGLNGSNFLYLISPSAFADKESYLRALEQSGYDIFIIDLFFGNEDPQPLTAADVARLRTKPGGGTRTLLCYMSIGQAERYRYYWSAGWTALPPDFIEVEDPNWLDNYYVHYWDPAWQDVICGSGNSYVKRIADAGFDGVYLDLVNAYEFYEDR